jgi:hypothetical protein
MADLPERHAVGATATEDRAKEHTPMAHFDVMFTNGVDWASRTFEAPGLHQAEQTAVQLAREYMSMADDGEDWSQWELRLALGTDDLDTDAAALPLLVTPFLELPG